jgi:ABC-type dipeptide/oligopeptide/nickel transport system permease component
MENLKVLIFPALVFGLSRAGPIMRVMRSSMLEVQRQDYIRTAWAKGLPERGVIFKHAIKNALIPVVSILGLQIHFYLGGSVIIESIFRLPGIGNFFFEALIRRDYPVVRGAKHQLARGHVHARAEPHRRFQLRVPGSSHPVSLSAFMPGPSARERVFRA